MTHRQPQPDPNERCHECGHARHHHLPFGYCFACHETHEYAFCQVCHQEMRSHGFKEEARSQESAVSSNNAAEQHADRRTLSANPEDP